MDPSSSLDDSLGILEDDSVGLLEDDVFTIVHSRPKSTSTKKGPGNEFFQDLDYPQFGLVAGEVTSLMKPKERSRPNYDRDLFLLPEDNLMNLGGNYVEDIELPSFDSLDGDLSSSVIQSPQSPKSPQRPPQPLPPMSRPPPESYNFFGLLEPEAPRRTKPRAVTDANDLIDFDEITSDVPREHTQDERPGWYEFLRSEILNIFHKYQVDVNYHEFISPQALMSAMRFYIDDLHVQLHKYATISQVPEIAASLSPEKELTQFESAPSEKPTGAVGVVVGQLQSNLNELREENLQLHELSFDLEAELAYAESRLSQKDKGTSALDKIDLKEEFIDDLEARNAAASQLNSSLHSDLERERSKVSRLTAALNEARMRIADLGEKEMTYVSIFEALPEGDLNQKIAEKMTRMAEAYVGRTRLPNAFDAESIRDEWARLMRDALYEVQDEYNELVLDKIQQEEMIHDKMETIRLLKLQEADVDNQIRNLKTAITLKKEEVENQKRVAEAISPEKDARRVQQSPPKKSTARKSPMFKQRTSTSRTSGPKIGPTSPMEREAKKISPGKTQIQAAARSPTPPRPTQSPRSVSPRPEAVEKGPKTTLKAPGRISPVSKQVPKTPSPRATAPTSPQRVMAKPEQGRETEKRLPERAAIPGPSTSRKIPEAPRRSIGLPRPMQFQKGPSAVQPTSKTIQLPSQARPTPLTANINVTKKQTERGEAVSCNIALSAAKGTSKPGLRRELKPPVSSYKGSGAGLSNRRLSMPKKY